MTNQEHTQQPEQPEQPNYYIDYYDVTNKGKLTRKDFTTDEEAIEWMRENMNRVDLDWLRHYPGRPW